MSGRPRSVAYCSETRAGLLECYTSGCRALAPRVPSEEAVAERVLDNQQGEWHREGDEGVVTGRTHGGAGPARLPAGPGRLRGRAAPAATARGGGGGPARPG